jgi:hypothetical protein
MAWNLKHATKRPAVPGAVVEALVAFGIDVALFNEFVDDDRRVEFSASLEAAGYAYRLISEMDGPSNQVLAVSRLPISSGDVAAPMTDLFSRTNWLHVVVDGTGVELIGMRIPAYNTKAELTAYLADLCPILERIGDRPIAIAGDFNLDPFRLAGDAVATTAPFPGAAMFTSVNPVGAWSFMQPSGLGKSRVDHVAATAALTISDVGYRHRVDDIVLAGPRESSPVSDHAALCFSVNTAG